jgi:hypothetical protein
VRYANAALRNDRVPHQHRTDAAEEGLFISWSRFSDSHTLPPPAEALPRAAAALNGCEHARSRNREGDKRTRQEMNSGQKASADRIALSLARNTHNTHTQPGGQKPRRCSAVGLTQKAD